MSRRRKREYAQQNAAWLIPLFGAVLLTGILWQNLYAMAAGAAGLGWVAWSVLLSR